MSRNWLIVKLPLVFCSQLAERQNLWALQCIRFWVRQNSEGGCLHMNSFHRYGLVTCPTPNGGASRSGSSGITIQAMG
jgi:hypothetical protein